MSETTIQADVWKPITGDDPPNGAVVMTRIDDDYGVRNERTLKRQGRLWFSPDMSTYVYYDPTHFRPIQEQR